MTYLHNFSFLFALGLLVTNANGASKTAVMKGISGAFVDCNSRIGKEQKVAMQMAIKDFNDNINHSFALHIEDTHGEPFQAALAAREFIDKQVQAILGPQRWEEASLVAEITSRAGLPMISLADATPEWAMKKWPFLVQASSNQHLQMRAIAAIVQSWEWHQVVIIYEDDDSSMAGDIPFLLSSLREVSVAVSHILPLPSSDSSMVEEVLEKIKQDQCRVFLVHLSLPLATRLFERAKKMEMMEEEYVWITTNVFANLIHSINTSTLSSMQGILGVKSYFPDNEQPFQEFDKRFRSKFASEYGEEDDNHEPGIHAVQAYDATWRICLAMKDSNDRKGQDLFNKILTSDFPGLSGKVQFIDKKLDPADKFQIINVVGRSYNELGFWSERLGFSKTINESAKNSSSMKNLGYVLWPGAPRSTPRGWAIPTNAKPLKIGVPSMSSFKQYVNVAYDPLNNSYSFEGLAIDLFKATAASMPYSLHYTFTEFDGTYDNLVEQIHLKKFDAVVGDVAIVAARCQHAEFTQPYTESTLVMIVPPVQRQTPKREWLFVKPFTKPMWALAIVINLYNGFIVWLIERNHCPELRGSAVNQTGSFIWLAFTTLFSLQGRQLHSNLSRMTMVVWLFVALVITQTYTANLASILTVGKLRPSVTDVQSLQNNNKMVGYCRGSFVKSYLINVLHFRPENVKHFNSPEEYAQALRSGEIAAVFLEAPFAELFLAKYCKEFIKAGPTYKVGGFGFVFPRGSPILPDVTKAMLKVSESGMLRDLENAMVALEKCVDVELDDEISSLSLSSFWVLFIITGGTSTIALSIYVIYQKMILNDSTQRSLIWRFILAVMKRKKQLSRRVGDAEPSPANSAGVSMHV
ncbi:glutamate receptor 2.8-like [Ricinus communis]|uniref:glutamate receptor 2.8-like n=1 Tax=Ricinus communis TaxID=3988 RepID=UPI00201A575C|nr:glutamate receptor 2.8-like [Ricinus communis]